MGYLEGLPPPDPHVDYKAFWEGCRRQSLLIQYCNDCGRFRHYPRPVCPSCRSWNSGWEKVSGKGNVWSFTIVREPVDPLLHGKVPYNIVAVELAEQKGLRLISNLVDCSAESMYIGMPVEVVFETVSPEITLPRFKPDSSRNGK